MNVFLHFERTVFLFESDSNLYINRFFGCFSLGIIGVFDKLSANFGEASIELPGQIDQRNFIFVFVFYQERRHRRSSFFGNLGIICSKGRGRVHNSGSVFGCNKVSCNNAECIFRLAERKWSLVPQLFITNPDEGLSFDFLCNTVGDFLRPTLIGLDRIKIFNSGIFPRKLFVDQGFGQ